ncbi:LysR family transcriptional regulator [Paenibacillus sp. PK3_47]|uniref:LysR family transcriptional regulator n=1 Tax=Paenibacillus sp. PK3_47 TaxID=2072642 RepID=UPI00201DC673|nr:LysR family transcriptional regulator [Paenibacillus sp. PK3_47]UQZ37089.1 LysR family transcriptional regulator [Paenibacillus sp. PK3_47]
MELYQLKTFIEIARTGNLTEAAASLNTSQPAASAHLKALEGETGFPLFYRTPKGMILTEHGEELLVEARKISDAMGSYYRKVGVLQNRIMETVRIGVGSEGKLMRISHLISLVGALLPQVELQFIHTKSEDFVRNLADSKIEAGFFYTDELDPGLEAVKLHSFRMAVVYPESWEPPEELSESYFAAKPWIWTTRGCFFYKMSNDYFLERNIVPNKVMYADDDALIGSLVRNEVGCALLPEPAALEFAEQNNLKIWKGIDLYVDLYFGYPKEKLNDPLLREIAAAVELMWREPA